MNTSESCLPSADSVFGPVVNGCRDFDFTFAFEQYIFSIVPSVLFLLAMPVRLRKLYGKPKRVNWTSLRLTKLVSRFVADP
jgi:ATP-binding cassette subfamily C (CFTR/MRP) protein 1